MGKSQGLHNKLKHMQKYKTFIRSCTNWSEFGRGRKITQETGLTYEEARKRCQEYAKNRTARQIRKGTMLEFTAE
jgi:hypothetical protein